MEPKKIKRSSTSGRRTAGGIATKHLQRYVDRFLFQKMLRYSKEAFDRPGAQMDAITHEKIVVTCCEVLTKTLPINLTMTYSSDSKNDKN